MLENLMGGKLSIRRIKLNSMNKTCFLRLKGNWSGGNDNIISSVSYVNSAF